MVNQICLRYINSTSKNFKQLNIFKLKNSYLVKSQRYENFLKIQKIYLNNIFILRVDEELRGKGIGKNIILDAKKWAKVKGFNAAYLISASDTRGFYKKCAYEKIESGEYEGFFKKKF